MQTENVSTLKIHKLTQAQYDRELAAGNIDETALYLTPDEEVDLSGYATISQLYDTTITTSGDGSAYTATVPNITELTAGISFIMVPNVVSTTTTPTLNLNGLGAKYIRRRLSSATGTTVAGSAASWITANKPVRVVYDGTFWLIDVTRPSGSDIYGIVPISAGGTGASSVSGALTNLGLSTETWTFTLEDGSTVTKAVYVG